MQVTINKVFPLDGSVSDAWNLLENIEQVASCMPGAAITETVDENNFKGSVKVKIGPMHVAFNGDIEVQAINADQRQVHLIAKGRDSKGSFQREHGSNRARAHRRIRRERTHWRCGRDRNGKLANFGGRMMTQVADQILDQFADNFRGKLGASASSEDPGQAATAEPKAESKPAVQEINGLKFAWQALIGFIKSFFTRKT